MKEVTAKAGEAQVTDILESAAGIKGDAGHPPEF